MKYLINKAFLILTFLSILNLTLKAQSPIVVNNTLIVRTCSLGSYGNATISVPTEALTGDNITLSITLPSTSVGCVKNVIISNSTNLNFVSSTTFSFIPSGTGQYSNSSVFDPINGQTFVVLYKFPNGTICDGAMGNFSVKFDVNCVGVLTTCTASVSVKARAANYWSIDKQFVVGNLTCGESQWKIRLIHNNPNGYGLGAYHISGTITETSPLVSSPVGATSVAGTCYQSSYPDNNVTNVYLKNCQAQGTTITNTATYNLTLGSASLPCGSTMAGTITATSPALASPNTSISFAKYAFANGGIFSNGCQGYYVLAICNNGNVPWTGLTVTDNVSIPGISVTGYSATGWTINPSPTTYTGAVTFTNPTLVLAPGACAYIYIYFTITGATGSSVTNNATLTYAASSSGSGSGGTLGSCPGITCPVITTSSLNVSTTCSFLITAPQAIPSIAKCNDPYYSVPIKLVNGTIKFRIQVANSGSASLTKLVTDALTVPQNLIITGTPTYTYYTNQNYNYCGSVSGVGTSGGLYVPSGNSGTPTNPAFNVVNLPGNCNLNKCNILVIEFDAIINPQLSGSKTNTAVMGTQSALANYTIDKSGELKIRKVADVATVENGASFNYILTVTNVGSTSLNNVVVTDNLPTCVQLNGTIIVKKLGVFISSSASGSTTVTVNPTAFINPGESFVITIPVKKVSGTNCCNPLATATAKLIPDAIQINATTPVSEPACVTSTSCCDIQSLTASLNPTHTIGNFNLNINAGVLPVQELEVSMLDYHVVYSNPDCKPVNMGIFGNVFSSTTTIGGLLIANNNTQNVNWGLGTPTIVNGNIAISISKPPISILDCCNGRMYFCLKVRVKNVDCKVCEKIICGSFNLKSNIIIWNSDPVDLNPVLIKPELKELNIKNITEQKQKLEIDDARIKAAIENQLKALDPVKAQEFLKRLSINPKQVVEEIKSKLDCCPSVPTTSGGTIPIPQQ